MRVIHSLPLIDEASVGAARRGVHAYASEIGFDERSLAELDIVVQEIATNAIRYASHIRPHDVMLHWTTSDGEADHLSSAPPRATPDSYTFSIQQQRCPPSQQRGIELFYTDKGPGIYDLDRALRDNVSFGGGLGGGFGAIRRLTNEFHIYSTVRRTERLTLSGARRSTHGTAILCRKWVGARGGVSEPAFAAHRVSVGAWTRPCHGEVSNGDAYYVRQSEQHTLLAVVDGLGHGSGAHTAARAAMEVLAAWSDEPLDQLVYSVHDALRATRGAVMSVALLDHVAGKLHFSGVGNIHTRVFNAPEPVHPFPSNGTLGARLVKVPFWTYPWAAGAVIIMASDGLSASWDISSYQGLLEQPVQLIAGVLARDYSRESDDATVLVVR